MQAIPNMVSRALDVGHVFLTRPLLVGKLLAAFLVLPVITFNKTQATPFNLRGAEVAERVEGRTWPPTAIPERRGRLLIH